MKKTFYVLFLLALFSFQMVAAQSHEYKDPQNRFSVKFPAAPQIQTWYTEPGGHRVEAADYEVFSLRYTVYVQPVEKTYTSREAFNAKVSIPGTHVKQVTFAGVSARETVHNFSVNIHTRTIEFLDQDLRQVYTIRIAAAPDALYSPEVEGFLSTFKLN